MSIRRNQQPGVFGCLALALFAACASTRPLLAADPAVVNVYAGNNQSAQAGTAVTGVVCANVLDALGNTVADGTAVTFAVTSGGGKITGENSTTTKGVATLGSWTLGPTPGANTLTATCLSATPATFSATATAQSSTSLAFASGPSATPSAPVAGQIVTFSVMVTGGAGPLTYTWSFGDGPASATGPSVAHTYTLPGTFNATVTVGDGSTSIYSPLAVTATSSGGGGGGSSTSIIGSGPDSDGDGFSDAFEIAAGTNPLDPNDKPANGSVQTPPSAQVGLSIKLNFAKPDSDSITLTGSLAIPAGFTVNGAKAIVDVGGVDHAFSLNQKGIGTDGKNSFKLSAKSKNGIAAAQTAKYAMKLVNGAFAAALASKGLIGTQNDPGSQHTITVSLVFAKTAYQTQKQVTYKCKKGKSGAAK